MGDVLGRPRMAADAFRVSERSSVPMIGRIRQEYLQDRLGLTGLVMEGRDEDS
jgi:hypothetical protein